MLWRVGYWLLWEAAWHWNGAEAERRGGKTINNSPALRVASRRVESWRIKICGLGVEELVSGE